MERARVCKVSDSCNSSSTLHRNVLVARCRAPHLDPRLISDTIINGPLSALHVARVKNVKSNSAQPVLRTAPRASVSRARSPEDV
jgi:hypothetical protein